MRSRVVLFIFCLMLSFGAVSCRSSAATEDAEPVVVSEVLEIEGCALSEPYVRVTPETLGALPEAVRDEAGKHCRKSGVVVVASSLRPRYFRLIRRQNRLLLGSDEAPSLRNSVFLSVISGLGDAADSIRSIKIEDPVSPDPWDLGVFLTRYPELADRIGGLPPGDGRLDDLKNEARELLRRGSTRLMLERHSPPKDPAAIEEAALAEQKQVKVLEEILNSK